MKQLIEILPLPLTLESKVAVHHKDELVLLDKKPYSGELPLLNYLPEGVVMESFLRQFKTEIPEPRANTYVLNLQQAELKDDGEVHFTTNYTTYRSLFALRRWIKNELDPNSVEYSQVMKSLQPLGVQMATLTADGYFLIEERGKVENPGTFCPAPAGGVETRNWKVRPDFFTAMQGEAWEETGMLPGKDYDCPKLVGVARDHYDGLNTTLSFFAKPKLTLKELILQSDSIAPEAGEHARLLGVPLNSDEIINFYIQNQNRTSGQGYSGILCYADIFFSNGDGAWLKEASEKITRNGKEVRIYSKSFP